MAALEHAGAGAAERTIALVGFMGAGKTRAAKGTGEVLGEAVVDLDAEIERELGAPPEEVFELEGESRFREVEERLALEALARGGIVALGGGAVESDRIRDALEPCFTVWCRISEEAAWVRCEGTSRPLARDRTGFARRFAERAPLYEEVADAVLTDGGERVGRLAARWLRAAADLEGARLAWAESSSGEYPAIVGPGALGILDALADRRSELNGATASDPRRWFAVADSGAHDVRWRSRALDPRGRSSRRPTSGFDSRPGWFVDCRVVQGGTASGRQFPGADDRPSLSRVVGGGQGPV